jgi:hypothetical protein
MTPLATSLAAFCFIAGGVVLGIFLRTKLPEGDLSGESKEVVRLGMGLIATLAALVLGLLISSAKSSYDAQGAQVRQLTAGVILLDNLLAQAGPGAEKARTLLRQGVPAMIGRIWREDSANAAKGGSFKATAEGDAFFESLQELSPQTEAQRSLDARAVQLSNELAQTRLLLYTQAGNVIPFPFLAVLVFWLTILFLSFSIFALPNKTLVTALLVCALSASGAIFLILDLNQPFGGLMTISSEPLRTALAPLAP